MTTPDPTPTLHVHPASGWLNDPHGLLWHDGRYHVFYQHNPDAPVWGNIHWAHVSSDDLVHWRQEPIALSTRPDGPDATVCSTGTVTLDAGSPVIAYTATTDASGIGPVLLARPLDPDLQSWEQGTEPAVSEYPLAGAPRGFRDPYFFEHHGHRWAVMTGGEVGGPPLVLLYLCDDIARWEYRGVLLSGDDPVAVELAPAELWECPQLFPIGDRWVLAMSLWTNHVLGDVAYLVGSLQPAPGELMAFTFNAATGGLVDHGVDFYAPTVHVDGDLRRLWAWSWDSDSPEDRQTRGTTGALTFPRLLTLHDDQLLVSPEPVIELLRDQPDPVTHHWNGIVADRVTLGELPPAAEVQITIPEAVSVEVSWLQRGDERVCLRIDASSATWDRSCFPAHPQDRPARQIALAAPAPALRLLLDGSMCEAFVGGISITERIYAHVGDRRELQVTVLSASGSDTSDGVGLEAKVWALTS